MTPIARAADCRISNRPATGVARHLLQYNIFHFRKTYIIFTMTEKIKDKHSDAFYVSMEQII
jgi:hypothetical protein